MTQRISSDDFEAAVFRDSIRQFQSVLGRLSYLASLRDPLTGRYHHVLLDHTLAEDAAHQIVEHAHRDTFASWLELSLDEHLQDLEQFFLNGAIGADPADLARFWASGGFGGLLPLEVSVPERQLFDSEIALLVEVVLGRQFCSGPGVITWNKHSDKTQTTETGPFVPPSSS